MSPFIWLTFYISIYFCFKKNVALFILMIETYEDGDYTYELESNNRASIVYSMIDGDDIKVLNEVVTKDGVIYYVRRIKSYAFYDKTALKLIFQADSHLDEVFKHSIIKSSILTIEFPPSLRFIHEEALFIYPYLPIPRISLPNGSKYFIECCCGSVYKKYPFQLVQGPLKKKVHVRKSTINIISYSFFMTSIVTINLPSSLTCIGRYAFSNSQIKKVSFAKNSRLEWIEEHAFSMTKIKEIYFPSTLIKICKGSFQNCNKLNKIVFPKSSCLTEICYEAFSGAMCHKLVFPESLQFIL